MCHWHKVLYLSDSELLLSSLSYIFTCVNSFYVSASYAQLRLVSAYTPLIRLRHMALYKFVLIDIMF